MRSLTKMAVSGAAIEPKRPIIEHEFKMVFRKLVGHCSAVKIYINVKAIVIAAFPNRKHTKTIAEFSSGIKGVEIIEIPANANDISKTSRRFIRLNNGWAIKMAGTSIATTNMKLT